MIDTRASSDAFVLGTDKCQAPRLRADILATHGAEQDAAVSAYEHYLAQQLKIIDETSPANTNKAAQERAA